MAAQAHIVLEPASETVVRIASPESDELFKLLFCRYPSYEWATFARLGWRESDSGLVLTIASIDPPEKGDLDETVGHIAIDEQYSLRTALAAESHSLAIGVIHSHPKDCLPSPSHIDDDMDSYYSDYFEGFAPARPYVSLIASQIGDQLELSGRVWWHGRWRGVSRFCIERRLVKTFSHSVLTKSRREIPPRLLRARSAFGEEASRALCNATVAVIGAGGTGSCAIEVLARAGVGRIIVVDPDTVEESNLERLHGANASDGIGKIAKVELAQRHIHSIDPSIEVIACKGALPQSAVIDQVILADVAVGCTDRQHSRLAMSELAFRYLLPIVDSGVSLEGEQGTVSGQTVQITKYLAASACALCRKIVDGRRIGQELMSEEERRLRIEAAERAEAEGPGGGNYWVGEPQLLTVGYLTTVAGALAAGYAIGWITQRFDADFSGLQLNLFSDPLHVVDWNQNPRPHCTCQLYRGWASLGEAHALITAPSHWPLPQITRRLASKSNT